MQQFNVSDQFPLDNDIVYLNHAAVSPWPKHTADAVTQFAQENMQRGATHYPRWLSVEQQLRKNLAQLINAPSSRNIALQKNTSEGLSTIAYGIDWQSGDQVVISDQEFPSNRIVWESLQSKGVEVVQANVSAEDPEQAIIQCFGPKTRVLSISSVQYGTGLSLDLEKLGQACQQQNILFCVDAIQSLGAIPFDVMANQADFVVADGHKWMLGPEGVALLYLSDKVLSSLKLNQFGWHMVQERGNYDLQTWQPAGDATRYECGSPNMLGVFALNASLELLLGVGIDTVHRELMNKISKLEALLNGRPELEVITDTQRSLRSGIMTFRHAKFDSQELFEILKDRGVVCAYRGGGIRFSPHFYTPFHCLERAVSLIPG